MSRRVFPVCVEVDDVYLSVSEIVDLLDEDQEAELLNLLKRRPGGTIDDPAYLAEQVAQFADRPSSRFELNRELAFAGLEVVEVRR